MGHFNVFNDYLELDERKIAKTEPSGLAEVCKSGKDMVDFCIKRTAFLSLFFNYHRGLYYCAKSRLTALAIAWRLGRGFPKRRTELSF